MQDFELSDTQMQYLCLHMYDPKAQGTSNLKYEKFGEFLTKIYDQFAPKEEPVNESITEKEEISVEKESLLKKEVPSQDDLEESQPKDFSLPPDEDLSASVPALQEEQPKAEDSAPQEKEESSHREVSQHDENSESKNPEQTPIPVASPAEAGEPAGGASESDPQVDFYDLNSSTNPKGENNPVVEKEDDVAQDTQNDKNSECSQKQDKFEKEHSKHESRSDEDLFPENESEKNIFNDDYIPDSKVVSQFLHFRRINSKKEIKLRNQWRKAMI